MPGLVPVISARDETEATICLIAVTHVTEKQYILPIHIAL